MHLEADELIALVEGTRSEASATHLASCDACRRQLADLRAVQAAVADVEVPEPSPLFWDHLSMRVHDAVVAEGAPRHVWSTWWRPRVLVPISASVAVAVLVVGLLLNARVARPTAPAASVAPPSEEETLGDVSDPPLSLVADLTQDMDWEAAHDAGLAPHGSAEHAVTHLSDGELRELQRLLQEELAQSGD
jgi:hypothetical protein